MDLFGALNNAFNGMNRTQNALAVVAKNVAGANQPGYVVEEYLGDSASGASPGGDVRRVLDGYVQKQLWTETSSAGFTGVQSDYVNQLNSMFGDPSSTNTIAAKYDAFNTALKTLQSSPGDSAAQSSALAAAGTLAQMISSTSNAVQSLRSSAEDAIAQSTTDVNADLAKIADINRQIQGNPDPSLQDSRDAAISDLASLVDVTVKTQSDGTVSISTRSGISLVDGATAGKLTFNSKSPLSATALYSTDPTKSGVGSLTLTGPSGGSVDLMASGGIQGGKLGGLIDLRDNLLPKAQSQLDDLAAGLASTLSDKTVAGTAVTNGMQVDLTGLQSGNKVHLDYTDSSGKSHHVSIVRVDDASQLPLANSATNDPNDEVIGVSFAGGVAGALSSLQSGLDGLGGGLTAQIGSNGSMLSITATSPASVTALSATITNTALQGQGTALPVFTDSPNGLPYTGSLDGVDQRVGFASRIVVNPQLSSNPSALSTYLASGSAGDPTRINDLVDRLNNGGVDVTPQSGLGITSGNATVGSLIRQIAQTQANDTNRLTSLNTSQSTILASIQSRFNQTSGVNMDQELTNMTQLQNVYTANARVLTTVKDMFDVLMRM